MNKPRWTLVTLCAATYMLLLDITIVNVALPAIGRDFGGGLDSLQWTVDAYVLPMSALIVAFGTLADRVGRRRVFTTGLVLFTSASLACGMATNMVMLDVARGVQGVGGGALFATTLALIGQEFTGAARGRAIVAWGSTVGAAVASGPLVGGLLTEYVSWRWIFLVNVPIGVVATALTPRVVGEGTDTNGRRLDVPGLVTLSFGLAAVTTGLLRGSATNWHSDRSIVALAGGLVLLLAFAVLQRRPGAMVDAGLYRNRAFVGVAVATVALGAGMFAMVLFLNIYLQNVLGFTPAGAGVRLLAFALPVFAVPILARRSRVVMTGARVLGSGLLLVSAGLGLMAVCGATTSWWRLAPGFFVAGVGVGLANPAIAATALAVVPPQRSGLASGVSNACRIAGITLGIAALGGVLRAGIGSALPSGAAHDRLVGLISSGHLGAAAAVSQHPHAVETAFTRGWEVLVTAGAVTLLLGAIAAVAGLATRRTVPAPTTPAVMAVAITEGAGS
jgi:EmrB/QacA subfamily drug resistance transporter